jgi:hypothetical protein
MDILFDKNYQQCGEAYTTCEHYLKLIIIIIITLIQHIIIGTYTLII